MSIKEVLNETCMSHINSLVCQGQLFHLNQIYRLLLLVIEYSWVNSFLLIFLFFQMYIADFK